MPTVVPASPGPIASPSDGADGKTVKLDIAPDKDVFVTVDDQAGVITDVKTGHAGDGMSVAWHEMKVENLGPSTLQLTWIGFADTERLVVTKGERDGTFDLTLIEVNPPNVIDATGYDRVLVLEFAVPVNADDITYSIDNGPTVDAGNEWDVELDIATDDDVVVTVEDEQAQVVDARTGHAGDGMSVRWFDMKIENVDELMLRVTWVGFAADEKPVLKIGERDGNPELTLVQAGPPPNSDAARVRPSADPRVRLAGERRRRPVLDPGRSRHRRLTPIQQGPDGPDPPIRGPADDQRPGLAASGPRGFAVPPSSSVVTLLGAGAWRRVSGRSGRCRWRRPGNDPARAGASPPAASRTGSRDPSPTRRRSFPSCSLAHSSRAQSGSTFQPTR